MYKLRLLLIFLLPAMLSAQSYKKLHQRAIVVDTHNDFPNQSMEKGVRFDQDLKGITHSDLKRMKEGGVDVQVFSIWCDGTFGAGKGFARANRQIDSLYAWTCLLYTSPSPRD